jgi:hypothetical protein
VGVAIQSRVEIVCLAERRKNRLISSFFDAAEEAQ